MKKIYYVANARMPSEKAHGIQIAKMCEAFVDAGVSLELIVSSRGSGTLKEAYSLVHDIPVRRMPVLDLQFFGPLGYHLTALQFILGSLFYLWLKAFSGEHFVVYTVDMDNFSFTPLVLVPRPLFAEMHSIKKSSWLTRHFFKKAHCIATNKLIATELASTFSIPPERLSIEPNGVDDSVLRSAVSKEEARKLLNLSDEPMALYIGRFYEWKGLEVLADTALLSPLRITLVGGTREEYEKVTKKSGEKLSFAGARPVSEIPLWSSAADVLLVLGTKKNEESYRYTSPMKIFEYLAARRSTVASRTPANRSILVEDVAFWYEPDDASSLARAIREAHTSSEVLAKVQAGYALATQHTWSVRAGRILASLLLADTLSR